MRGVVFWIGVAGLLWGSPSVARSASGHAAPPLPVVQGSSDSANVPDQPPPPVETEEPAAIAPLFEELTPFKPAVPRTLADQEKIEAYSYFAVGRLLQRRRDLQGAMEAYQKALEHDPEAAAICRELISIAFALDRTDEAVEYALKAAELDPSDRLLLRRWGLRLESRGDRPGALRLLERAAEAPGLRKESADFVRLSNRLGRLYTDTGQYEKAADAFALVLEALQEPERYLLDQRTHRLLLGRPQDTYEKFGRAFLKAGRAEDAIRAFQLAQEAAPEEGRFSYNLAQVYASTKQYEKALEELKKYFDEGLSNQTDEPYKLLAVVLEELGRGDELIGILEDQAERSPNNSTLQYFLADWYLQNGDLEKAESRYNALIENAPEPRAYRGLATVYRQTRQPEELVQVLGKSIEETDDGGERLQNEIEAIASDAELVDDMVDATRRLKEEQPDDLSVETQLVMAEIAGTAKRVDFAAELYDSILEERPNDFGLYLRLERLYETNERYAEAAETVQRAIDHNVAPTLLFQLALPRLLELSSQTEAALEAARSAINAADTPDTQRFLPEGRFWLAWVYYHANRYEEASEEFERLIADFPNAALEDRESRQSSPIRNAHFILSNVYVQLGNTARAVELLERILQHDPNDAGANNDLGYLLADEGKDLDRAEKMIRKAVKEDETNAAYLDSLGWVLYKRGKFQEAVQYLEKATAQPVGGDPVIWDHLGDAYLRVDRVDKAQQAWQKALELIRQQPAPDETKVQEIEEKIELQSSR